MNNNVKELLESIKNDSNYIRVSETHPLELYVGKNEAGELTLRYNGQFKPKNILGNNLLKIKQVKTNLYNSIMFTYCSKENISMFYNFCEDMIEQTINASSDNGYTELIKRYELWRKMFSSNNKILSEPEILGLIGELLFLNNVSLNMYSNVDALNGWSGPEPTHKDFSYGDDWYEIKSINDSKNSIIISSIEQLDSPNVGRLIVYKFEKMSSSFNGISLNNLVKDINNQLVDLLEKDIFAAKLADAGYMYNEVYDNYVYNLISVTKYIVDSNFPRLEAINLPKEISKIKYEILLPMIERFKEN